MQFKEIISDLTIQFSMKTTDDGKFSAYTQYPYPTLIVLKVNNAQHCNEFKKRFKNEIETMDQMYGNINLN